jgi:hypothetical protein
MFRTQSNAGRASRAGCESRTIALVVSVNPSWRDLSEEWYERHPYQPQNAFYVIVSEPEDSQSSDPTKASRYVALLPAKVRKPKS